MRCLADFILDSDLRFPDGSGSFAIQGPNGSYELALANIEGSHEASGGVLSAQLIFETESLHTGRDDARFLLAQVLNCLSYATNRSFSLKLLKRLIDWTPGAVEREAIIFVETPEWDSAEPELTKDYLKTSERLLAMQSGEEHQRALRWYRLALKATNIEEQFSYFWFALEISAECQKGTEKVPSKCPKCRNALRCERCNEVPMHRRYPGEAIQQTVERVHPKGAEEIFKALQTIRHTLMHGGRIESVIDELPCTAEQAINKLAFITWHSMDVMFSNPDPQKEAGPLHFGYLDSFVRRTLVAGAHVKTTLKAGGDPNDPRLADFPNFDFTVENRPSEEHKRSPETDPK